MSNYTNLSLCSRAYVFISSTDIIITKKVSAVLLNDWYENLHDVIIKYSKVSVNDWYEKLLDLGLKSFFFHK